MLLNLFKTNTTCNQRDKNGTGQYHDQYAHDARSAHTTNVIISHSSERILKKYMAAKHELLKNITIENIESDKKKICSLLKHVWIL